MNVLRRLALGVLSSLFITLLFATAFDVGFVRTATHPSTVKKLVAESGIYDTAVNSLLQQTKSFNTEVGTVSASDPTIQKAANKTITPQFIKQNSEMTIDSIYAWLNGKTTQPDFKIDLSSVKNNFADNFSTTVEQKLATLPACSRAESSVIAASGQYDAINATCLPQGVTAADAAAKLKASIAGNGDFLQKTTLSADNLKGGGNNQSIFSDKLKSTPKQYQRAKKTPLILIVLTILCGTGIVLLSTSWQKGLRHIGTNLVVIGLFMLIFSYALNVAAAKAAPKISLNNAVLQQAVRNLVIDLVQQVDKNYWFFGGLYTLLGAGGIAAAEVFHRKTHPVKIPKSKGAPETEAPEAPEPDKKT